MSSNDNIELNEQSLDAADRALNEAAAFVDSASVSERESVRKQLAEDVEAFLAKGGKIEEVAPNVLADPPKKPQSNYGGQPI